MAQRTSQTDWAAEQKSGVDDSHEGKWRKEEDPRETNSTLSQTPQPRGLGFRVEALVLKPTGTSIHKFGLTSTDAPEFSDGFHRAEEYLEARQQSLESPKPFLQEM